MLRVPSFPPMFLAITALPPVASIIDTAIITLGTGYTIFSAESAFSPTRLETNTPSTIWYRDINTSITVVGICKLYERTRIKFLG